MRRLGFLISISLSASIAAGIVSAQTIDPRPDSSTLAVTSSQRNDRYRIGYQDVISIQVDRHPDLNQSMPVRQDGTIELLRIKKTLVAVCKTEIELASDIETAYREKILRNPNVRVSVTEQRSQPVMVLGFVNTPNTYYLNRRMHLLEVLGLAGGPNKEAGTRMIVARQGSTSVCKDSGPADDDSVLVTEFKVRDVLAGKSTFWIEPGDTVSVLDSDIVYVYGNVNDQGAFKTREPITLTQAIISAKGLKGAAKKDKIRILRQKEGSLEREEFIVDLNQIEKGKANDPYLLPNDIVAVSEDKAKSILMGFVDSLKGTIPNAIYRIP